MQLWELVSIPRQKFVI